VEAETRHAGASGAASAIDRFWIDSVSGNRNVAAGVRACGKATANGSRIDVGQPGLIARQSIGVFRVGTVRVPAAALQQRANPLRQYLRQIGDFGILRRP
jgi:hypothetical protein